MAESDDVEETKAKTCIALAMHATTNQKFGAMSAGIIIASIVIALLQKSFWPFVIGVVVSFSISYFMRLSCYRHVERITGLPRIAQDHLLNLYKTDQQFAAAVERARDDVAQGTSKHPSRHGNAESSSSTEAPARQYSPETLALILDLFPSVLGELQAREAVFRGDFDDNKRRSIIPFGHLGRKFMQQEEFDIWIMLSECKISESQAIERITDIMEKYYGAPYPLR